MKKNNDVVVRSITSKYTLKKIEEYIPNLTEEQYDKINNLLIDAIFDFYNLGKDGYKM